MSLATILDSFPPELQPSIARLAEALREEFGVRSTDFDDLKAVVRELAEAQKRTENRVEKLADNSKELATAQKRTEDVLEKFRQTFDSQIGGLRARLGLQTEEAFRQGMRTILQDVGFTTERFWEIDTTGEVFGVPEQIELDVVIKNGTVIVIEIKSSLDKGAVYQFARKAEFYARSTGRQVNRKLIVTPYADTRAQAVGTKLDVEICTDVVGLR